MKAKLIAALVLVVVVVVFAAKNATPREFWLFRTFYPNLSLLLLVTLIVGIVVGLLVSSVGGRGTKERGRR